jgi:hypothetical protein
MLEEHPQQQQEQRLKEEREKKPIKKPTYPLQRCGGQR